VCNHYNICRHSFIHNRNAEYKVGRGSQEGGKRQR
jgi:hypothetical protein